MKRAPEEVDDCLQRVQEDVKRMRLGFLGPSEELSMEVIRVMWDLGKVDLQLAAKLVCLSRSAFVLVTGQRVAFPAVVQLQNLAAMDQLAQEAAMYSIEWQPEEEYLFFAASWTLCANRRIEAQGQAYERWLRCLVWVHRPIVFGSILDTAIVRRYYYTNGFHHHELKSSLFGYLFAYNTKPGRHLYGVPRFKCTWNKITVWHENKDEIFSGAFSVFF